MIRLVAAIDQKHGLARNGQLPWDLPTDQARFRALTKTRGANVLMGRRTYELMSPSYFKQRHGFVLTNNNLKQASNVRLVKDTLAFIKNFDEDLWVIGGAMIYTLCLPYADELYLTLVLGDFNCDQFFPDFSEFKLLKADGPYKENGHSFSYQFLRRF